MSSFCVAFSIFIIANISCIMILIHNSFSNYVIPEFVGNSYDSNLKEELDSVLLKSVQKYISKYFNSNKVMNMFEEVQFKGEEKNKINIQFANEGLNGIEAIVQKDKIHFEQREQDFNSTSLNFSFLNKNDHTVEILKNYQPLKITNSTKLSVFLDTSKKLIYILMISNDKESPHRFDTKVGELSLFYIPLKNFKQSNENTELKDSFIQKCWTSKFHGRILGAVSSSDKKQVGIFYRIIKGHTINYRIRYFHNITCENYEIEQTDQYLSKNYMDYLNTLQKFDKSKQQDQGSEWENYYEIHENNPDNREMVNLKDTKSNNTYPKIILSNYFNDDSYDDFAVKGNTPINAMTIKKDVIAYARNLDFRQFYILKRDNNIISGYQKRSWKVSLMGPLHDKKIHNFFHTNSLKFANDDIHDYKILQVYLAMNKTEIQTYGYVIKANHTDYLNNNHTPNYSIRQVAKSSIESEVLNSKYETFNVETSIQKLKNYMIPTIYSNSNDKNLLFEFKKGTICIMGWSKKTGQEYFYNLTPKGADKVSKMSSDENNENIIMKLENSNKLYYLLRYKEKQNNKSVYYDILKNVNLKNIPKKYREKEVLAYTIENINNRLLLFILNENGILITLDLTKVSINFRENNWLISILLNDLHYTVYLIVITNLFSLFIYFKYFYRNQNTNILRERSNEINQVIQDIIRLNNLQMSINGNIQNVERVVGNTSNIENHNVIQNSVQANTGQNESGNNFTINQGSSNDTTDNNLHENQTNLTNQITHLNNTSHNSSNEISLENSGDNSNSITQNQST